jgi:CxxC motif-containing protein (DUF1111 family)
VKRFALLAVAVLLPAGLAGAGERPARTDLTPKDVSRVRAVTAPTTDFSKPENFEAMPAGAATTKKLVNRDSFSLPAGNLDFAGQERFNLGNGFFTKVWVSAPASTAASDGLGPLFNARACQNCHLKDGRGHPPADSAHPSDSMLVRLSVPGTPAPGMDVVPDPVYGTQLQESALAGLQGEAHLTVDYTDRKVTLGDGTVVTLRDPHYALTAPQYGDFAPGVMLSPRVAPQMIGLGLLEDVPTADILAHADPDDTDHDGISGRARILPGGVLGRFGWKAGMASIEAQVASAFAGDLGISTPRDDRPYGDCTKAQVACFTRPTGVQQRLGATEAPDPILALVTFYSQNLGVPQRRDVGAADVLAGKALFYGAGCPACHVPKYVTSRAAPQKQHRFQLIWPYSDMLLHDMGPGLADNRPEGDATGREWRTPPLWGIGLTQTVSGHTLFLHDGRARNLTEAILWHGGEGQGARDRFAGMSAAERAQLIAFLGSL